MGLCPMAANTETRTRSGAWGHILTQTEYLRVFLLMCYSKAPSKDIDFLTCFNHETLSYNLQHLLLVVFILVDTALPCQYR